MKDHTTTQESTAQSNRAVANGRSRRKGLTATTRWTSIWWSDRPRLFGVDADGLRQTSGNAGADRFTSSRVALQEPDVVEAEVADAGQIIETELRMQMSDHFGKAEVPRPEEHFRQVATESRRAGHFGCVGHHGIETEHLGSVEEQSAQVVPVIIRIVASYELGSIQYGIATTGETMRA